MTKYVLCIFLFEGGFERSLK